METQVFELYFQCKSDEMWLRKIICVQVFLIHRILLYILFLKIKQDKMKQQ